MPRVISRTLTARLRRVRLFLCDVDGVLTDGTVPMGDGKECKSFNIQDGLGLILLMRSGVKVGCVSNRPSNSTQQRAKELGLTWIIQSKRNKVEAIESILAKESAIWEEVCYI